MLPGLWDPFWVTLLSKMLATAATAVAVSMLVERVGVNRRAILTL